MLSFAPRFAVLALASCVYFAAGCAASQSPARVPQGAQFFAGDPNYDAFFLDLHDAQVASARLVSERIKARKPLTDALGLPETAAVAAVSAAVVERFPQARRDADFATAVEYGFKAEQRRRKRLHERLDDLKSLMARAQTLTPGVATVFRDSDKAQQVQLELAEARKAIDIMGERTAKEISETDAMVAGLQAQIDAALSDTPAAKPATVKVPAKPTSVSTLPAKGAAATSNSPRG